MLLQPDIFWYPSSITLKLIPYGILDQANNTTNLNILTRRQLSLANKPRTWKRLFQNALKNDCATVGNVRQLKSLFFRNFMALLKFSPCLKQGSQEFSRII